MDVLSLSLHIYILYIYIHIKRLPLSQSLLHLHTHIKQNATLSGREVSFIFYLNNKTKYVKENGVQILHQSKGDKISHKTRKLMIEKFPFKNWSEFK